MAGYNKYDLRLESLVIEGVTHWDAGVADLTDDEKKIVAQEIHRHPELASKISYERAHTGFARIVTVTEEDIARLYEQNIAVE
ncbi:MULTISPECIES: hypothetical protein [Thalassoglobus]|uniref:Uncharacterized protein n=1 Tax=Thalassoglobus polymorphus TaxID=2527994 RepID=A0A517QQE3_9PLAN|nr:hypothetical protein [Thalassoglobus polymorphus]QDT33851.1 hypothetical protein Mal48_31070 [Thalassoglobus polymorphus]